MPLKRLISASAATLLCWFSLFAQTKSTALTAEDLVRIALERNQEYLAAQAEVRVKLPLF